MEWRAQVDYPVFDTSAHMSIAGFFLRKAKPGCNAPQNSAPRFVCPLTLGGKVTYEYRKFKLWCVTLTLSLDP
jgi:hypothetical protein